MILWLLTAGLLMQQAPPPPGSMRLPDAHGGETAVYRALKPGEQRGEGLLRRIVCPGRGPITLVVKQGDKIVQYTAAALSAVDFIDYRQPPRGAVSCEGFGAGDPVYVTYKAEAKAPRAIAVEFLRK